MALSADCTLDLGGVLALFMSCTSMDECSKILEKSAFCIATLTLTPDIVRIMKERKKSYWLVNVNEYDLKHVYRVIRNPSL